MKSPLLLWREVVRESGDRCRVVTTRDIETVTRRVEGEGVSFLTITLPAFGKDFDEALSFGRVDPTHFPGFRRMRGLPRFLGGFLDLVFDRSTGVLLDSPSVDAILGIRQITRLVSKILLACTYKREKAAMDGYIKIEHELEAAQAAWTQGEIQDFQAVARRLFGRVFSRVDNLHATNSLVPKHGPGATADRLLGNDKYNQLEWHWRLEQGGFHSGDYLLPNSRFWLNLDRVKFVEPGWERPVKVTPVPKTLSTPRIIAIEPTCMQYTQQAVAEALTREIEADSICRSFVGFTDQAPNQQLARKGSRDGSLATLDLSEASDRVSNQLVEYMFAGFTHLGEAVQACRSLTADVPGHGIIPLTKFASMGSALCFPVEAMVFTSIVFLGIQDELGHRLTAAEIKSLRGKVRIYGDDIIVPVEYTHSVIGRLEAFGFKVNRSKSFWIGNFRESCGKEYFRGIDVSIVKLRELPPTSHKDATRVVSLVSFRNQLYAAGYREAVEKIDRFLEKILLGHFPRVTATSPVLGKVGSSELDVHSFHPTLHHPVSKGWKVRAVSPRRGLDGEGALLKFFLKRSVLPYAAKDHLERSGRPLVVGIKLGKGPT